MTLIADSGALYALYDADDRHHSAVRHALEREHGSIVVPSAILGELDYLLREFLGVAAELDFLESLQAGVFSLEAFTSADLERCRELIAKYRDLDLGLADASVVATAERLSIHRVLTVDERDFRAVVPRNGRPLTLVPADEG
ncbi:MAG: PIN domain-containing protein [Acidobacteriota bacterium]